MSNINDFDGIDVVLRSHVDVANDTGKDGIPVTLTTTGGTVTGTIMPRSEWLKNYLGPEAVDEIAPDVDADEAEYAKLKELKKTVVGAYRDSGVDFSDVARDLMDAFPHTQYIHLRDAKLFAGAQLVPTSGTALWRGNLAHVVGWFQGSLAHGEPSTD